ncbi:hypothetical protein R3P38DRAFT_1432294 [Favolaschia claudopus]|uniref:Uncharacterized protein n=1 Tax=Favolaschia claudopus TaxID=2862362 RepID=A0AAW0APA4_9AGAR
MSKRSSGLDFSDRLPALDAHPDMDKSPAHHKQCHKEAHRSPGGGPARQSVVNQRGPEDNLNTARATFGVTFTIARAAALVLHVDVIFILLPVCRNFVSVMRRTPLGAVIPFDKNLTLHKATAWAIFTGSLQCYHHRSACGILYYCQLHHWAPHHRMAHVDLSRCHGLLCHREASAREERWI